MSKALACRRSICCALTRSRNTNSCTHSNTLTHSLTHSLTYTQHSAHSAGATVFSVSFTHRRGSLVLPANRTGRLFSARGTAPVTDKPNPRRVQSSRMCPACTRCLSVWVCGLFDSRKIKFGGCTRTLITYTTTTKWARRAFRQHLSVGVLVKVIGRVCFRVCWNWVRGLQTTQHHRLGFISINAYRSGVCCTCK